MLTCKNYKGLRIAVPTDTNIRFLDQGDLKKTFSILFEEMGFELTDRSRAKDVSIYQHKEDNLLYNGLSGIKFCISSTMIRLTSYMNLTSIKTKQIS
jgi:hypothetical protein